MNFQDSLVSDPGTFTNPNLTKEQLELDRQIRERVLERGELGGIEGALGDVSKGSTAYVEEVYKTNEGVFTKLYGISYPYRGFVDKEKMNSVILTKGVLFETLRAYPLILLRPKKAKLWAAKVCMKLLNKQLLPPRDLKKGIRELVRVAEKHFKPVKVGDTLISLVRCVAQLFEFDNAYWGPVQDALCCLDKKFPVMFNVVWFFERLEERHNYEPSKAKYRFLKRIVLIALRLSPKARRMAQEMWDDLNLEEIKPDEADRYFNLNRTSYDYEGRSYAERRAEWEEINKREGNVIFGI